MGHRVETRYFLDRESAEEHQQLKGIEGYSEVYPRGITETQVIHPITNHRVNGFKSELEIYYG